MKQEEALDQIKYIRDLMDKATDRMFFSPWQWIEWGFLGLAGGLITEWLIKTNQYSFILNLWIIIFIIGGTLETFFWFREAKSRGIEPFNPFLMKMWGIAFSIFLFPIIFTTVFIQIDQAIYIPGLWLISTGIAMFSMVIFSVRKILLFFCETMVISGILAVSIFLKYGLEIFTWVFGFGALLIGILLLIVHPKKGAKK